MNRLLAVVVVCGALFAVAAGIVIALFKPNAAVSSPAASETPAGIETPSGGPERQEHGRPPPLRQMCPSGGPVSAACFNPDGKRLLTADYLCRIALWSPDADKPLWLAGSPAGIDPNHRDRWQYGAVAVGFSSDGKRARVAWKAGVAELDVDTGALLRIVRIPDPISYLVFVPWSDECVYFSHDRRLIRFDIATGQRNEDSIHLPEFSGLRVAVSPGGRRAMVYDETRGYVAEWDLRSGEFTTLSGDFKGFFEKAGYTPDGKGIWLWQETFAVIDRQTGKRIPLPGELGKYHGRVWLSRDEQHAIGLPRESRAAAEYPRVDILETQHGRLLKSVFAEMWYTKGSYHIPSLGLLWDRTPGVTAFTPDGKTMALTGGDVDTPHAGGAIGFWDLETGRHIRTVRTDSHHRPVPSQLATAPEPRSSP